MTEEKAKTKWCPMVRNHDDELPRGDRVCNRYRGKVENVHKCIASDCMMWVPTKEGKTIPCGRCGLAG